MKVKNHIRAAALALVTLSAASSAVAQSGQAGYEYLNIPVSAHSAALGCNNVSIGEDDASLMFENPALLSNVSDLSLGFNFTSFIAGSKKLSTGFVRQWGNRGTWAVGAQVLAYGSMTETDATGVEVGKISATDIDVQGSYAYMLSDYWSGGVTAKFLFANYANYSSFAMGVDLGINYYNEEAGASVSLVGRNLGGQLKAFHDKHEKLPFTLGLGWSQTLANAPVRFSLTMDDLTHWKGVNFIQHFIVGVEVFPTHTTWIALGYNVRRAHEMKVLNRSHWAGLSLGAGLSIKRFKVGIAYGKYHVAASSLIGNIAYTF